MRPLDKAHRAGIEIFAKAGVGPFGGIGEPIKIEVVDIERTGVECERIGDDLFLCKFDDWSAKAFQLTRVLLHELGHHADRMHTHAKRDNGPRGEDFADNYAFDLEREVLERYFAEFGLPE